MAKTKEKNLFPESAFDQADFSWMAPEYLRFERTRLWYIVLCTSDALLLAYAYFSESWTMLLLFVVLPLVLIAEHRHKPENVEVGISPYGIKFGRLRIPYSDMQAFWILHLPPIDELHLHSSKKVHSDIVIPLSSVDPSILRAYLLTQIPELEGKRLSLLDMMIRIFRLN